MGHVKRGGTRVADLCRGKIQVCFFKFLASPPKINVENAVQQLHPCIETLNSRNLGFAKDSLKASFDRGPYVKDSLMASFDRGP